LQVIFLQIFAIISCGDGLKLRELFVFAVVTALAIFNSRRNIIFEFVHSPNDQ
jgi:hypothetical protein